MTERANDEWADLTGLAAWFGFSKPTLRRKLPSLYAEGFPRPSAAGKWYLPRCRNWANGEGNLVMSSDPLMEALDGNRLN